MPQIWMTYDEIGAMLDCSSKEARERAIAQGLDRKRSRDGLTRAKLNLPLASLFISMASEALADRRDRSSTFADRSPFEVVVPNVRQFA